MHPTVLPPAEEFPPTKGLLPAEGLLPADRLPPAGKLHQRTLAAANICTTSSSHLFIMDRISKQQYLVDTGSDLCVFPCKLLPGSRGRTDYTLYVANGTTIPTYEWTSHSLNLGLRSEFIWCFVIADVQVPIIGVDLFSHYGPLVDCRNNHLLNRVTSLSTPGLITPPSVPSVKVIAGGMPLDSLPEEFPVLMKPTGSHREVWYNTTRHICTTPSLPVACCPHCLDPDHLAVAKAEFIELSLGHAAGWHSQTHRGPKLVCPPSRAQEGQWLEALWRLPSPEGLHHLRQVSSPTHTRLLPLPFRLQHLFQN